MPVSLPSVSEIFPGYVTGVSKEKFDEVPEIQDNLDKKIKETIDYINRGDLGIPSHALKAAAFQYSGQCGEINQEFMLCKREEVDPRKCLKYNEKVSICAEDFFRKVTDACADVFVEFGQCLERNNTRNLARCRSEQYAFDKCLWEKLGYDKPFFAVTPDMKIKTDRPRPKNPHNYQPTFNESRTPEPGFFSKPIGHQRD